MLHTLRRAAAATFALAIGACAPTETPVEPAIAGPSLITSGSLAGSSFPGVVLILMDSAGVPSYRCTGTMIAPKLVLTAGHCTGEAGEFSGMRVFTESDVQNGDNDYPNAGGHNTIEAESWATYPGFTEKEFFLHDVGYIVLKDAVTLPANEYGQLPALNSLDALKPSSKTTFTSVGYGVQLINKAKIVAEKVRMFAQPHLLQINNGYVGSQSLLLSNNNSTGGTCFGDSGGPNFLGNSRVIASVTSFGKNGSCGGTGGSFRMDRQDVRDFVNAALQKYGN